MMFRWSADVLITLLFSSELNVTSRASASREVDSSCVSSLSSLPGLVKLTSVEMTVLTLVDWLPFHRATTCSRRSEILFEVDESMFVDVGCFSVGFGEYEKFV